MHSILKKKSQQEGFLAYHPIIDEVFQCELNLNLLTWSSTFSPGVHVLTQIFIRHLKPFLTLVSHLVFTWDDSTPSNNTVRHRAPLDTVVDVSCAEALTSQKTFS